MDKEEFRTVFPERLQEQRRGRGMTQKELGAATGSSFMQISHYETGRRQPGAWMLLKLSDALGVSLDFLTGRTQRKKVG